MLSGVILLWAILTAASVVYVAADIRNTPEAPVLKVAFIIITLFIGPLGAFLYVLGCREPLPGLHEQYTASQWRQTLGSTMHCVAGDGVGIIAGAALTAQVPMPLLVEIVVEYALGFGFGWTIFQALFMRHMSGSYRRALISTFLPELLSMNALMAAMAPVMMIAMRYVPRGHDPASPRFWFIMSMGILAGFGMAYPVNWWLVANHLKHGMMTVARPGTAIPMASPPVTAPSARPPTGAHQPKPREVRGVWWVTAFTFVLLIIGIVVALQFARMPAQALPGPHPMVGFYLL